MTDATDSSATPWWKRKWGIAVLVIGVLAIGGALLDDEEPGDDPDMAAADEDVEPEEAEEPEEPADPCPIEGQSRQVSAECIDPWPLTVDSGTISCDAESVTIEADGKVWAVNGMADTRGDGDDIDPIWAEGDDGIPKVSIGELIDAGLDLCA